MQHINREVIQSSEFRSVVMDRDSAQAALLMAFPAWRRHENLRRRIPPEKTIVGSLQAGSSAIFLRMKKRRCAPSRSMKGVPGVMQLESKASPAVTSPFLSASFSACHHARQLSGKLVHADIQLGTVYFLYSRHVETYMGPLTRIL